MKLTQNEKQVLKLLLDNGRISDVDMASKLRITTQAVGKIRKKLEEKDVIRGYSCDLDLEKLGLNVFVVSHCTLKDKFWKDLGEVKAIEVVKKDPHTIFTCMPSSSEVSVISIHAFRDTKEMDRYFHLAKVRNHPYEELKKSYAFSSLNLLNSTPKELIKIVLDNKPIVPSVIN
jgi:DNA-binding Lrp family transcriptional regulator